MPKKTRREKILADLRRYASPIQTTHYQFQHTFLPKPTATSQAIEVDDFAAIKKDLTKTLILGAIAITVEFILSVAT